MCQGCQDYAEFEAAFNAYVARELPKMLARPEDIEVLFGTMAAG